MITGPRRAFEAKLRQRGYTWADVEECVLSIAGETVTVDENHPAYPRARSIRAREPGLGDRVAAGIKAAGRMIGVEVKECCGCRKRRELLNRLGDMITRRTR